MEISLYILAIIFLTYWSGFFSGSEIALFSLPTPKISAYRSSPDPKRRLIAKLLAQPRDLLVTIFMLNTLVNILLQNVSSSMFGSASSWMLRVGVPLLITLILGEIVPKYVAMQKNIALSYRCIPLINWFTNIIRPLREWTVAITTPISRLMFFFLKKEKSVSREELQHILETSQQTGVLSSDEAQLIDGYLDLQDASVKEVMRPREDVLYYTLDQPLTRLTHLLVDQECTRIPVCEQELDHVLGIITADEFFIYRRLISSSEDLKPLLTKPFFLPESTPAWKVMSHLAERSETLALIVDEHRAVTGLVTREDLVEEVIGEIYDRRDQVPLYTKQGQNVIIASGKLELDTLEDLFEVKLESPNNMLTIGGWLTERASDIPKVGFELDDQGLYFHVLEASPTRIVKVYIRRKG